MMVKATPCMIETENSHWKTTFHWKLGFVISAWMAIAAKTATTNALTHLPGRGTGLASSSSTPSLMCAMSASVGGCGIEFRRRQGGFLRAVGVEDVGQVAIVH